MQNDVPLIDLAAKQQCMEADRMVLMASGMAVNDSKSGHCWCWSASYCDILHHVCCKCGDRYKAERGE